MRILRHPVISTLIWLALCSAVLGQSRQDADLIVQPRGRGHDGWEPDDSIRMGASRCEGTRLWRWGRAAEIEGRYKGPQSIDARGRLVLPGFINGHTHVPMTLFRGLHDDVTLNDWLYKYIFPAEAKNVNEEFVRWGTSWLRRSRFARA